MACTASSPWRKAPRSSLSSGTANLRRHRECRFSKRSEHRRTSAEASARRRCPPSYGEHPESLAPRKKKSKVQQKEANEAVAALASQAQLTLKTQRDYRRDLCRYASAIAWLPLALCRDPIILHSLCCVDGALVVTHLQARTRFGLSSTSRSDLHDVKTFSTGYLWFVCLSCEMTWDILALSI